VKTEDSNKSVHVLIVGNSTDTFVRHAVKLVCDRDIEYILCDDIYSAVVHLSKNGQAGVIVIGRFENLYKEGQWVFRRAREGKFSCCCLANSDSVTQRRRAAAVSGTGIFLIDDIEEIEKVVTKILRESSTFTPEVTKMRMADFSKEKFAATMDEINALFGT